MFIPLPLEHDTGVNLSSEDTRSHRVTKPRGHTRENLQLKEWDVEPKQLDLLSPCYSSEPAAAFLHGSGMPTCLEGHGDILPPVHLHHGSPASLQLPHNRAIQGFLFYPVTHILGRKQGKDAGQCDLRRAQEVSHTMS